MVDQLWMWIIDGNTIITSFPKRYGVDQDPSGVYEAIEKRLKQKKLVRTAFHIALIVLDECSKAFFSRTKGSISQHSDIDIFSQAIMQVVREHQGIVSINLTLLIRKTQERKQTHEFKQLWAWINMSRKVNFQEGNTATLELPTRNMGEEGELEKEIQDIVEELDMIISINTTQHKVIKKFIRHARVALSNWAKTVENGKKRTAKSSSQLSEEDHERSRIVHDTFKFEADELLARVGDRIDDLQRLLKTAKNAAASVCTMALGYDALHTC